MKKIRDTLWVLKDKRIAVWGLTFKPDTDDVRSSVAIDLVNHLLQEGAIVQAYDPKGGTKVAELNLCKGAILAKSALEAVENAEALVLATEWNEFRSVDFQQVRKRMHTPIIFDGRNLFDPETMKNLVSDTSGSDARSRIDSGARTPAISLELTLKCGSLISCPALFTPPMSRSSGTLERFYGRQKSARLLLKSASTLGDRSRIR